jgi:hypothetical protein
MSEPKTTIDGDQLIYAIDDLHSVGLEIGSEAAFRLMQVLGYGPDETPSGAELRARLREVLR